MKFPEVVYSEEGWVLGEVKTSPCSCLSVLYLRTEPYKTMVFNAMTDYALEAPYEENGYRLASVSDVDKSFFEVLAKSVLEEDLWVKIGEVHWSDDLEEKAVFILGRIRVNYTRNKK